MITLVRFGDLDHGKTLGGGGAIGSAKAKGGAPRVRGSVRWRCATPIQRNPLLIIRLRRSSQVRFGKWGVSEEQSVRPGFAIASESGAIGEPVGGGDPEPPEDMIVEGRRAEHAPESGAGRSDREVADLAPEIGGLPMRAGSGRESLPGSRHDGRSRSRDGSGRVAWEVRRLGNPKVPGASGIPPSVGEHPGSFSPGLICRIAKERLSIAEKSTEGEGGSALPMTKSIEESGRGSHSKWRWRATARGSVVSEAESSVLLSAADRERTTWTAPQRRSYRTRRREDSVASGSKR